MKFYGSSEGNSIVRAVKAGDYDGVRRLAENGADVRATDAFGASVLLLLCRQAGHIGRPCKGRRGRSARLFQYLMKAGADPFACDRNGDSAMWWAIRHDEPLILGMIGDRKSMPPDARNIHGYTTLQEACLYDAFGAARMLSNAGADAEGLCPLGASARDLCQAEWVFEPVREGYGALDCATAQPSEASLAEESPEAEMERLLVYFEEGYYTGNEVLEKACRLGSLAGVRRLLSMGVGVEKSHVLDWALLSGHEDVAEVLLHAGADIDRCDSRGNTPLLRAASRGHAGAVCFLLGHGAAVNVRNREGDSALMRACKASRTEVALLLLQHGANAAMANARGRTAAIMARAAGNKRLYEALCGKGTYVPPCQDTRNWLRCSYFRHGAYPRPWHYASGDDIRAGDYVGLGDEELRVEPLTVRSRNAPWLWGSMRMIWVTGGALPFLAEAPDPRWRLLRRAAGRDDLPPSWQDQFIGLPEREKRRLCQPFLLRQPHRFARRGDDDPGSRQGGR